MDGPNPAALSSGFWHTPGVSNDEHQDCLLFTTRSPRNWKAVEMPIRIPSAACDCQFTASAGFSSDGQSQTTEAVVWDARHRIFSHYRQRRKFVLLRSHRRVASWTSRFDDGRNSNVRRGIRRRRVSRVRTRSHRAQTTGHALPAMCGWIWRWAIEFPRTFDDTCRHRKIIRTRRKRLKEQIIWRCSESSERERRWSVRSSSTLAARRRGGDERVLP